MGLKHQDVNLAFDGNVCNYEVSFSNHWWRLTGQQVRTVDKKNSDTVIQVTIFMPKGYGIFTSPHFSGQLGRAIGYSVAAAAITTDNITPTQVT